MSHFAKIIDGTVVDVIGAEQDYIDYLYENNPNGYQWVRTQNLNILGCTYNVSEGTFHFPATVSDPVVELEPVIDIVAEQPVSLSEPVRMAQKSPIKKIKIVKSDFVKVKLAAPAPAPAAVKKKITSITVKNTPPKK